MSRFFKAGKLWNRIRPYTKSGRELGNNCAGMVNTKYVKVIIIV